MDNLPSDTSIRVLHVAESARGGVGTYLNHTLPELETWRGADSRALRNCVLMPAEHRFMLTRVADDSVSTYRRDGRGPAAFARLAAAMWHALRRFRPDVVHLHSSFAGMVGRPLLLLSRALLNCPRTVIYSPHGWAFQITGSRLRQGATAAVERALALLADRIVVLSDAERAECIERGFPAAKLVRIYNGIETAPPVVAPATWSDPRIKVLFVGRFDRQKGLDTLLEAARAAPDRVHVRCAGASVVGDDETQAPPANVEMIGWCDETQLQAHYAAADVIAVPSRWEGFGLVAAEAMRAQRAVVASHVGGLPEVVEDGVTGRLVPPDDAPALLAALLADDDAARAAMGAAGYERFRALFTAERSAAALAATYAVMVPVRSGEKA